MKRFGLVVLGALLAVDCGGGDGGGPPVITAAVVSGDSTVVLAGSRQLTATAMAGGTPISTGVTFQWTSSDTTRATVSSTGLVSGVRLGSATITARVVLNGTPTAVVSTGHGIRTRIGAIVISPATPGFASLGDSVLATAEGRDALGAPVPGLTFTWQSRSTGVATATARANNALADVVAVANGTARIVVSADGISDSVTATVQQVATTLAITPDTVTFGRIDSMLTPVVTANDARGNPVSTSALTWTTQSGTIATVSPATGVIQSKSEGQTRVIGSSGGLSDTVRVGVALIYGSVEIQTASGIPAPIDSATIVQLNGSFAPRVIVRDVGNTIVPSPSVVWSLKHSGTLATIDAATGVVTGNANTGRDTIVVVARTVRDSISLIVRQEVATVVMTPKPPGQDLNFVGDTMRFSAEARDAGGSAIPGKTPVWSTSRQIITIDANGLAEADSASSQTGIVVRIRVDIEGRKDSTDLRTRQVPASALLDPNSFPTIATIGRSLTASCIVEDSGGTTIPTHPCTWSAVTPGVVSFSPTTAATTNVTAIGNGSTTINATAFVNVFAPNFVQVDQVPVSISLAPENFGTPDVQMRVSQTAPFVVVLRDSLNNVDNRVRTDVSWSVTPGTSATVAASTGTSTTVTTTATPGSEQVAAQISTLSLSATRTVAVVSTGVRLSGAGGVQAVFTGNCTSCHPPTENMDLSTGAAFGDIVDVTSNQQPLMKRVRPFRPDSSYLVHKIQGTQTTVGGSGVRMPFGCSGASCLSNATINLIRNWILQGALNN
jgi:Bacterial Ig-like domain (group 2)